MTTPSRIIRILVVDDEPLSRKLICTFLEDQPDMQVVGEASNGVQALELIEQHLPDLVFLDIQIPYLDGLKVVRSLPSEKIPIFVFVTAFDQFALEAFELDAIDYLLKPFDKTRFTLTLQRIRKHIERVENAQRFEAELLQSSTAAALPDPPGAPSNPSVNQETLSDRLLVRANGRLFFARTDEVQWIEAQGNYISLRIRDQSYLLRQTMQSIEKQLDPGRFQRIQRSIIVNIDAIEELHPLFRGDYMVVMREGTKLRMSARYRPNFNKFMLGAV
jgi:two-component system LytT family response regulator